MSERFVSQGRSKLYLRFALDTFVLLAEAQHADLVCSALSAPRPGRATSHRLDLLHCASYARFFFTAFILVLCLQVVEVASVLGRKHCGDFLRSPGR